MKRKRTKSVYTIQRLTPWFPSRVKPVHPGVYLTITEYDCGDNARVGFARWTGRKWLHSWPFFHYAETYFDPSGFQEKIWCGVVEKPETKPMALNKHGGIVSVLSSTRIREQ